MQEQRIKRTGELIGAGGDAATVERELASMDFQYDPNNRFPSPPYHPDWDYRWVSVSVHGETNSMNIAHRRSQGWRPVQIVELPEFAQMLGAEGKETESIRVMSQVLHKMPRVKVEALKSKQAAATMLQSQAETAFGRNPNDELFVGEVVNGSKLTHTVGGRQVRFGDGAA